MLFSVYSNPSTIWFIQPRIQTTRNRP